MPGPEAGTIEVSVFSGQSARPSITFTIGTPAPPMSIGTAGQWNVMAEGVGPIHVYIAFDGQSVFAAAAAQDLDTLLAGSFIGTEWAKASPPCELRFGGACLILQEKGTPKSASTAGGAETQRAPGFWHEEHTVHDGGALWQAAQRAKAASQQSASGSEGATPAPPLVGTTLGANPNALQYPPVRPAAGMPVDAIAPTQAAHTSSIPPRGVALDATTPLADAPRFRDMSAAAGTAKPGAPTRPFESPPETIRGPRPGSIPPTAAPPGDPLAATIYGPPQPMPPRDVAPGAGGQGRSPYGANPPHAGPSPYAEQGGYAAHGGSSAPPPMRQPSQPPVGAIPPGAVQAPSQPPPQGAPQANVGGTIPPQGFPPPADAVKDAAKKDEKPSYWKSASNVKKATILLMPFVLVLSYFMLQDEEEAPPAKVLSNRTSASAQRKADAGPVPIDAGTTNAPAASAPASPNAAAAPSPSAAVAPDVATVPAVAPAVPIDAGPSVSARDAGVSKPGTLPPKQRTPERQAIDAVATGSFAEAAKLYDVLALAHPDDPTFKEAARILREKSAKPE